VVPLLRDSAVCWSDAPRRDFLVVGSSWCLDVLNGSRMLLNIILSVLCAKVEYIFLDFEKGPAPGAHDGGKRELFKT
jgi:hypothetical protein